MVWFFFCTFNTIQSLDIKTFKTIAQPAAVDIAIAKPPATNNPSRAGLRKASTVAIKE